MKLDLHLHSTVSDGTDTPQALLALVRESGLGLFSLTDHDAVKGCEQILRLRGPKDPAFLTGVEFSCRDGEGKYHILGYGFDPEAPSIRRVVETGHSLRVQKLQARLEFLKTRFGFRFPEEELRKLRELDNPGKPHIGNLMVKYGYAASKEEAIRQYIDRLRSRTEYVRPETAIEGILGAGGIPVLAHPCYGSGDELILGDEMDSRLKKLMNYGLQGLEAFYSGFSDKLRQEMLAFAERYGLYVTAGSDYHGKNKLIAIGETGLGPETELPAGMRRFLKDVNYDRSET